MTESTGPTTASELVFYREKLDGFLQFNERDVLKNAARICVKIAQQLALDEYDKFQKKLLTDEAQGPDEFEACAKQLGPCKPSKGNRS